MRRTVLPLLLLLLIATLATSCAPSIRVERLKPALHNDAAILTHITIKPFTGPDGRYRSRDSDALTRDIASILHNIEIDGVPYFSVTLQDSGRGKERFGAARGGLPGTLGGYGVMGGHLLGQRCFVEHSVEERRKCVKYKDSEAAPSGCVKWRPIKVDCFKSTAEYGFDLHLKERESKRVVYTLRALGTKESSACNSTPTKGRKNRAFKQSLGSIFGLDRRYGHLRCESWTGEQLLEKARQKALGKAQRKLRRDIAPHYVTETIRLMDSEKGIESADAKERLKKGIEYAKNLWLLKGCAEWKEADRLAPENTSIIYNLGVCAEFYGRYKEAEELYDRARSFSDEPNDLIDRSTKRVKRIIRGNKALTEQMNNH
ncbi:MAG: hypothetical protein IME99_04780 [Proteobacteria bacterium]|nr:hypothetical protein [Pseudomonadota bacterium]